MIMMKGLIVDESMTSFTSTSGEVSASSATRFETATATQYSFASTNQPKKKRSLPGNPDPDSEVIALSPKTLMATNRFICEICNKGFQRDQNLQLHRRGHNLPWKLKQRTNKDEVIRKKVYVCPETTCVHHDPSRALGDLTGIKKHFCRKHGEKKWKCEKCSKLYAVQSDWKAHSKICGTREYRCDCGTLFSRRDSFITHRGFCDALAEESARAITTAPNPLILTSSVQQTAGGSSSVVSHMQIMQSELFHNLSVKHNDDHVFKGRDHSNPFPPWLAARPPAAAGGDVGARPSSSALFLLDHDQLNVHVQDENPSQNPSNIPLIPTSAIFQASVQVQPHMSATALLQKAAQMGIKPLQSPVLEPMQIPHHHHHHHQAHHMSGNSSTVLIGSTSTSTASSSRLGLSARDEELGISGFPHGNLASFGNKAGNFMEKATNSTSAGAGAGAGAGAPLHNMMNSSPACTTGFEQSTFNWIWNTKGNSNIISFQETLTDQSQVSRSSTDYQGRGNDGLTRDFLGLKDFPIPPTDFPNLAGLNHHINSSSVQNRHHQKPWQS